MPPASDSLAIELGRFRITWPTCGPARQGGARCRSGGSWCGRGRLGAGRWPGVRQQAVPCMCRSCRAHADPTTANAQPTTANAQPNSANAAHGPYAVTAAHPNQGPWSTGPTWADAAVRKPSSGKPPSHRTRFHSGPVRTADAGAPWPGCWSSSSPVSGLSITAACVLGAGARGAAVVWGNCGVRGWGEAVGWVGAARGAGAVGRAPTRKFQAVPCRHVLRTASGVHCEWRRPRRNVNAAVGSLQCDRRASQRPPALYAAIGILPSASTPTTSLESR